MMCVCVFFFFFWGGGAPGGGGRGGYGSFGVVGFWGLGFCRCYPFDFWGFGYEQ